MGKMSYFILKKPIMVVIQNSINDVSINEINLKDTLQQVITDLDKGESELLIRIVDKAEIQNLNKTYRHKDQVTNVLSFPSDLPVEIDESILGDVVICTDVVDEVPKHKTKPLTIIYFIWLFMARCICSVLIILKNLMLIKWKA